MIQRKSLVARVVAASPISQKAPTIRSPGQTGEMKSGRIRRQKDRSLLPFASSAGDRRQSEA